MLLLLIVVVCGLPGVGKSTLAKDLAPLISAVILSSDKIRKELFPKPIYSKQEVKLIYDVMILLTKYLYRAGINCIIDATFSKEKSRTDLKNRLMIPNEELHMVECICPEDAVVSRLKSRKNDYSDADLRIYKRMKKNYEPILEDHIVIDTCRSSSKANAEKVAGQLE
jgi:predicted kinase